MPWYFLVKSLVRFVSLKTCPCKLEHILVPRPDICLLERFIQALAHLIVNEELLRTLTLSLLSGNLVVDRGIPKHLIRLKILPLLQAIQPLHP